MNEFDSLRAVLNQKADAACGAIGLPVELMNEQFTPPQNVDGSALSYATFFYRTGGSKQCELGGNGSLEMTVGIFQFDILVPEYADLGPPGVMADQLRKSFNRKQWIVPPDGYVNTLTANVKTPFPKAQGGFFRIIVDGTIHFYHRDTNPQDFRS